MNEKELLEYLKLYLDAKAYLYEAAGFGDEEVKITSQVLEERPEGKWCPVKERLPEESVAVLIWCPERKNIYCAYWEEKRWWIFGAGWEEVTDDVTAWMPLPEPPSRK